MQIQKCRAQKFLREDDIEEKVQCMYRTDKLTPAFLKIASAPEVTSTCGFFSMFFYVSWAFKLKVSVDLTLNFLYSK